MSNAEEANRIAGICAGLGIPYSPSVVMALARSWDAGYEACQYNQNERDGEPPQRNPYRALRPGNTGQRPIGYCELCGAITCVCAAAR
jgi:hypothetical protein